MTPFAPLGFGFVMMAVLLCSVEYTGGSLKCVDLSNTLCSRGGLVLVIPAWADGGPVLLGALDVRSSKGFHLITGYTVRRFPIKSAGTNGGS